MPSAGPDENPQGWSTVRWGMGDAQTLPLLESGGTGSAGGAGLNGPNTAMGSLSHISVASGIAQQLGYCRAPGLHHTVFGNWRCDASRLRDFRQWLSCILLLFLSVSSFLSFLPFLAATNVQIEGVVALKEIKIGYVNVCLVPVGENADCVSVDNAPGDIVSARSNVLREVGLIFLLLGSVSSIFLFMSFLAFEWPACRLWKWLGLAYVAVIILTWMAGTIAFVSVTREDLRTALVPVYELDVRCGSNETLVCSGASVYGSGCEECNIIPLMGQLDSSKVTCEGFDECSVQPRLVKKSCASEGSGCDAKLTGTMYAYFAVWLVAFATLVCIMVFFALEHCGC